MHSQTSFLRSLFYVRDHHHSHKTMLAKCEKKILFNKSGIRDFVSPQKCYNGPNVLAWEKEELLFA